MSCTITVPYLFDNVKSMSSFVTDFQHYLPLKWTFISVKMEEKLEQLQLSSREYQRQLFVQGIPIGFCDGNYIRMSGDAVKSVFQGKESQKNVVCLAVAGPQSSGKSTLLRRLFGIEARASAGQTTHGINCCRINTDTRDVILVDTEGIGSTERIGKNNKATTDQI